MGCWGERRDQPAFGWSFDAVLWCGWVTPSTCPTTGYVVLRICYVAVMSEMVVRYSQHCHMRGSNFLVARGRCDPGTWRVPPDNNDLVILTVRKWGRSGLPYRSFFRPIGGLCSHEYPTLFGAHSVAPLVRIPSVFLEACFGEYGSRE